MAPIFKFMHSRPGTEVVHRSEGPKGVTEIVRVNYPGYRPELEKAGDPEYLKAKAAYKQILDIVFDPQNFPPAETDAYRFLEERLKHTDAPTDHVVGLPNFFQIRHDGKLAGLAFGHVGPSPSGFQLLDFAFVKPENRGLGLPAKIFDAARIFQQPRNSRIVRRGRPVGIESRGYVAQNYSRQLKNLNEESAPTGLECETLFRFAKGALKRVHYVDPNTLTQEQLRRTYAFAKIGAHAAARITPQAAKELGISAGTVLNDEQLEKLIKAKAIYMPWHGDPETAKLSDRSRSAHYDLLYMNPQNLNPQQVRTHIFGLHPIFGTIS